MYPFELIDISREETMWTIFWLSSAQLIFLREIFESVIFMFYSYIIYMITLNQQQSKGITTM
jgi:hypothetical protein